MLVLIVEVDYSFRHVSSGHKCLVCDFPLHKKCHDKFFTEEYPCTGVKWKDGPNKTFVSLFFETASIITTYTYPVFIFHFSFFA